MTAPALGRPGDGALGGVSLPSQIAQILEDAITSGSLRPGQRLRGDELATTYGVSRIPVREALRTLEASGWIEIRPRYGAYVRQHSAVELVDLFQVRAVLEGYGARCATERRTDDDLLALSRIVAANKKAVKAGDHAAYLPLSIQFISGLHEASHNAVLEATLAGLAKRARFYYATVASELGRDWADLHEAVVQALRAGDADRAAALVHDHIQHTGRAVGQLLQLGT